MLRIHTFFFTKPITEIPQKSGQAPLTHLGSCGKNHPMRHEVKIKAQHEKKDHHRPYPSHTAKVGTVCKEPECMHTQMQQGLHRQFNAHCISHSMKGPTLNPEPDSGLGMTCKMRCITTRPHGPQRHPTHIK